MSAFVFGMNSEFLESVIAQSYDTSTPNQHSMTTTGNADSTNKAFWINTVHLDGKANINGDDMHPPEPFPNSALPAGGGFVLKKPDDKGSWMFRAFTFEPAQIVVHQGDKVTLNFVGVQGFEHAISVDGFGEFTIHRGEIHTITFTADNIGTINYECHIHMPNMHGQILVLPRTQ